MVIKEIKRSIKYFVTYQYDSFDEWQEHEEHLIQNGWKFESTSQDRTVTYSRDAM